jgi:hypothetical protein
MNIQTGMLLRSARIFSRFGEWPSQWPSFSVKKFRVFECLCTALLTVKWLCNVGAHHEFSVVLLQLKENRSSFFFLFNIGLTIHSRPKVKVSRFIQDIVWQHILADISRWCYSVYYIVWLSDIRVSCRVNQNFTVVQTIIQRTSINLCGVYRCRT